MFRCNVENEAEDNNSNEEEMEGETESRENESFEDFVIESLEYQHAADDEEVEDDVSDESLAEDVIVID